MSARGADGGKRFYEHERAVMTLLESTLLEWNVYHWGPLFYSEARNAEDSDASRKSRKE